jgi:iron complex outermembrane recepter protein
MKTRILLLFLSFNALILAQNTLSGIVSDEFNNPLEGVKVCLQQSSYCTTSNRDGVFILKSLLESKQMLVFNYAGFETKMIFIDSIYDIKKINVMLLSSSKFLEEIQVTASRAPKNVSSAVLINEEELNKKAFGQDLPILLDGTPSLITTSDAGNGVGYTGLRIRGVDASRINVTINGIPVNDPESHDVYWVNMPDLSSSIQDIQIQRGVGSSTNGAAAFGASLNVKSSDISDVPFAVLDNSYGSFNTMKNSFKFSTGLLNKKWSFESRLSRIASDGFLDRAASNLNSFFLSGAYLGKKTVIKAILFSGQELTYQAWYGTPESVLNGNINEMNNFADRNYLSDEERQNLLSSGRSYNFYTYENQVDNYKQDNYQLHLNHAIKPNLTLNIAAHYTYGRGYYEEYKTNQTLGNYGLPTIYVGGDSIINSDLIRRRWLDNDFIGSVYSLSYTKSNYDLIFGGAVNTYLGRHYGEVIWARFASNGELGDRYYDENGQKSEISNYIKGTFRFGKITMSTDLQYRHINYSFLGIDQVNGELKDVEQMVSFNFINPKLALAYQIDKSNSLFVSAGISNREPVRRDFRESTVESRPKAETLRDIELGYTLKNKKFSCQINGFFMHYLNQLILTGKINDVGSYTRTNVPKSYRLGIEIQSVFTPIRKLSFSSSFALSANKLKSFTEFIDVYDTIQPYYSQQLILHKNVSIAFSPAIVASFGVSYTPIKYLSVDWLSKFISRQYLDNTSNLERSIKAFTYSNLSINYLIPKVFGSEVVCGLQINNVFNLHYANNGYTFSYQSNGQQTTENFYYPQAGRNFMLRVKIKI